MRENPLSEDLLDWYDAHARELPWRVSPSDRKSGIAPAPYRVWLSEIMLQQTTVAAVKDYFLKFTRLWPDVMALAEAKDADVMAQWAGLGYYARARNLLKCARIIAQTHGGHFPRARDALQDLPGIGPYTSAAIAAIAFDQPETVVDGNVERVMARLHAHSAPLPAAKPMLIKLAGELTPQQRPGDYAQAVMDLGATICTPKSPACGLCPWAHSCAGRIEGIAHELPRKTPKSPKPTRHGIAYVLRRPSGEWLLETRPARGLLGGMLGWPCSAWDEGPPTPAPPAQANWRTTQMQVRHSFTHFHLELEVQTTITDAPPDRGEFYDHPQPARLPKVMRKVYDAAKSAFDPAHEPKP